MYNKNKTPLSSFKDYYATKEIYIERNLRFFTKFITVINILLKQKITITLRQNNIRINKHFDNIVSLESGSLFTPHLLQMTKLVNNEILERQRERNTMRDF